MKADVNWQNPFDDPVIVACYESWYHTAGRRADHLEKKLLSRLLANFPAAQTLLEPGCGTGHFARWFQEQGLRVVGIDLSLPMLTEANDLNGLPTIYADAHLLPFADDAFDLVALITTLEFVSDPVQVVREALRIARQGLLLGVLNRHSLLAWQRKREQDPIWQPAQFFTPSELMELIYRIAPETERVVWQTTLWPLWPGALHLPWGGFIGLAAHWSAEVNEGQR
jgi:ubiquinone/menaquinone biosynthesis C-methylase UbiE